MKPLIYIAGPYTKPDPVVNTRRAMELGFEIHALGGVPHIPHLTLFMHFLQPRDIDFWYDYDLDMLEHCHAVYRFMGVSTGADKEVAAAHSLGVQVFVEEDGLAMLERFIQDFLNQTR